VNQRTHEWMVLYATDPYFRIDSRDALIAYLADRQLIAGALADNTDAPRYAPGTRFMELLVFTGCSPSIGSAEDDSIYNQYDIELPLPAMQPRLVAGSSSRPPECPECRAIAAIPLIETRIIPGQVLYWECPQCNARVPLEKINWKRRACVTSSTIVINGIHEGEAVPSDELLTDLQSYSGVAWSYCYCRGK